MTVRQERPGIWHGIIRICKSANGKMMKARRKKEPGGEMKYNTVYNMKTVIL